jgi:multiple antibiotic resistance protein
MDPSLLLAGLWYYGVALLALFPIVDPITAGFSFAGLTHNRDRLWAHRQALLACVFMVIILLTFQVLGTWILRFFAITLEAIRVAGGIMIWYAALEMLRGTDRLSADEQTEGIAKQDIAFTPMAMPLLSGPGAIAVTLTLSARSERFANELAVALAVVSIAGVTYLALRFATALQAHISETSRLALSKVLGFLLLCVGVQFIMSGVAPLLGHPDGFVPAIP